MNNLTPEQVDALHRVLQRAADTVDRREATFDDCHECGAYAPNGCTTSCKRVMMISAMTVVRELTNNRFNHQEQT